MAGKVPYSNANDLTAKTPSSSYEDFPSTSSRDNISDILPISRKWSNLSGCSSELTPLNQLQEQYTFSVEQCFKELETVRRKKESMFIQVKKAVRDKIENMLKNVKQSFEYMHVERTKQIEMKCEEIGRVLTRVDKMIEEGNPDAHGEAADKSSTKIMFGNETFVEKVRQEKARIEEEVETLIAELNKKRENDEQIYVDFKEDIQQQIRDSITRIEQNLESHAERQAKLVEQKIMELRKTLINIQHLSKSS